MLTREEARVLFNRLHVFQGIDLGVNTQGGLTYKAPRPLTDEQRELLTQHKLALILYMKSPPKQAGMCYKGHSIIWYWTSHHWVCDDCWNESLKPVKSLKVRPVFGQQKAH